MSSGVSGFWREVRDRFRPWAGSGETEPLFQREREGPAAKGWEGEGLRWVTACRRSVGHLIPSPQPSPFGRGSMVSFPPFTDLGDDRFRASGECLTSGDGLISGPDPLRTPAGAGTVDQ